MNNIKSAIILIVIFTASLALHTLAAWKYKCLWLSNKSKFAFFLYSWKNKRHRFRLPTRPLYTSIKHHITFHHMSHLLSHQAIGDWSIIIILPSSPHQSKNHLFHLRVHLRMIFFYAFRNKRKSDPKAKCLSIITNTWLICAPAWLLPRDCGELLLQGLDVSELDGLSSSSCLNHLTL